jgi:hypothetical protein
MSVLPPLPLMLRKTSKGLVRLDVLCSWKVCYSETLVSAHKSTRCHDSVEQHCHSEGLVNENIRNSYYEDNVICDYEVLRVRLNSNIYTAGIVIKQIPVSLRFQCPTELNRALKTDGIECMDRLQIFHFKCSF